VDRKLFYKTDIFHILNHRIFSGSIIPETRTGHNQGSRERQFRLLNLSSAYKIYIHKVEKIRLDISSLDPQTTRLLFPGRNLQARSGLLETETRLRSSPVLRFHRYKDPS